MLSRCSPFKSLRSSCLLQPRHGSVIHYFSSTLLKVITCLLWLDLRCNKRKTLVQLLHTNTQPAFFRSLFQLSLGWTTCRNQISDASPAVRAEPLTRRQISALARDSSGSVVSAEAISQAREAIIVVWDRWSGRGSSKL